MCNYLNNYSLLFFAKIGESQTQVMTPRPADWQVSLMLRKITTQ